MSKSWIGTSGWTYDGWRGPFYPVHGEFVNHAAIGIWNRPRQWGRQA